MINIPTIISIMFCCICAMSSILGIYTICSDSKSMTNKLFFALTISLVLWSLGLGMAVSASDLSVSLFWRRFSALGWGTFFSIMLHFLITFTERSALLNRRWKYILLYSPSLLLILGFSYFTGLNHEQYNLIRTPLGWANVAANNYWDWFFNIYYLVYFGIGLYFVWKLRKTDISKNKSRQSKLIFVSFLITILIGAFVENYLNTLFSVKIPQIAPILMIYPMTTIYYAMRKFGLFNVNQNTVDSILFSRQIQQRIINYLSISFIAGSILNIIAMYLILKDGDTVITVLFSLFLIFLGFVFQIIQRLNTDNRTKEIQYAAAFFLIIPIITLRFIGYCSESIWAFAFIILIIAIVLEKKTIQIAISVSVLLTQVIVLLLKPISTTTIDIGNHFVRISLYAIAIWIAFFITDVYKTKLIENAYQIRFQQLVSEISREFISVNEESFGQAIEETLSRIGRFMNQEHISFYLYNNEKNALACTYNWVDGSTIIPEHQKNITPAEQPLLMNALTSSRVLDIPDINHLSLSEYDEIKKLTNDQIKSLLAFSIENNNNKSGYLFFQSLNKNRNWSTVEKNNLSIIANIIAETIERINREKQINFMAYYDSLTELPNRGLFLDRLNQAIYLSQRTNKKIAVLFLDLDSFKFVNDTMGHQAGDELIVQISKKLFHTLRKSDTVSSFGGDEFLIMLNNINNKKEIYKIADKITDIFKSPFSLHEKEVYVTASAGISVFPYDGEDADTLIRNADIAMYHAKINGKSQYCLCTSDMKKESSLKHELSNKLYRAIDNDEFVLYYQPQISLQTNEIVGVESLIRWKQPEHGFISPSIFIPIAEQIGLIRPIGEWVLKTACTQYRIWMDMGCSPIRMSVNVSVLQLRSQDFVTVVSNVIKETGIEPKYLEIEITESAAVKESDYIVKVLEELKELGINITIDDFGMEYSSLNRLNLMPVNRIKIDLHFIRNLLRSDKDQSIINGMIHLSHALGIKVLAEGVEEQYQLEFLREHSCDEVQGYLLHRPLPAEKFIKLLKGRIKDQK